MLNKEQILAISSCLANPTRLSILGWLKQPDVHFPDHCVDIPHPEGVCMGMIAEKTGMSQSTVSTYLNKMERAGILVSTRIGKWSYYRRNETVLDDYAQSVMAFEV